MKKIIIFSFLILFSLSLSGCKNKEEQKMITGKGGIFKSSDGGETFFGINKIDDKKNLSNESILDIVIDPNDSKVVYVGTKNSGIFRSSNGGQSWAKSKSDFSYVRRIELDPTNENIIYIIAKSNGEMSLFKTTDGGINWKKLLLQQDAHQPIVTDVLVDQKNPQIIYATDSTNGIYKSMDGGEQWQAVYWGNFPTAAILMDSQDDNQLYFATNDEEIYITSDGGKTFKTAQTSGPIYSLAVSKFNKDEIYILWQGGLSQSIDGGETFKLVPTLLKPNETVANLVVTDPMNNKIVYVVAGKIIYKTENNGETWQEIPLKNISWAVTQFEINPQDNKQIYLGVSKPAKQKGNLFLRF